MPLPAEDTSPPESSGEAVPPDDVVVVDPQGDLILHVKYNVDLLQRYQVSISVLRKHSSYFSALLDSSKFSEGIAVESRLADLRTRYTDMASIPAIELPRVTLSDVGVGPKSSSSFVEAAFRLCLGILHGSPSPPDGGKAGNRLLYALLIYFADMLAVIPAVSEYMIIHWSESLFANLDPSTKRPKELKIRQMLYIGLSLGFAKTVTVYSTALVVWGSNRWLEVHNGGSTAGEEEFPWDYLEGGVEAKLRLVPPMRFVSTG
ncbi:MAG: hypothetical protein Q9225_002577 [Loekoesia sp. 1 TL-2023]